MALSARARAIARTRAALAKTPVVYVLAIRATTDSSSRHASAAPPGCDTGTTDGEADASTLSVPAARPEIAPPVTTAPPAPPQITLTIAQVVELHVSRVLLECDGNVSEAAKRLGIYRSTLQRRLRSVGR